MKQAGLFDRKEATTRREKAIDAVASTDPGAAWIDLALPIVERVARSCHEFTTDRLESEFQKAGLVPPYEKRAMGPLMRRASSKGWIESTDRVQKSSMPSNHRRPKAVWRSRIFDS